MQVWGKQNLHYCAFSYISKSQKGHILPYFQGCPGDDATRLRDDAETGNKPQEWAMKRSNFTDTKGIFARLCAYAKRAFTSPEVPTPASS